MYSMYLSHDSSSFKIKFFILKYLYGFIIYVSASLKGLAQSICKYAYIPQLCSLIENVMELSDSWENPKEIEI